MDRYQHFQIADFISDEYFLNWVLNSNSETELFWNTWINEHPQQLDTITRARNIIESITIQPSSSQLSAQDVKAIVESFQIQTRLKTRRVPYFKWLSTAAAVLMVVTVIWFKQKQVTEHSDTRMAHAAAYQKIVNRGPSSRLIRLSDKSLVLLRPDSELDYPLRFGKIERSVRLSGEAFFEVTSDPSRPFLVKAGNLITKVLGTSFDVVSSKTGTESSVLVKTGKVQVYSFHQQNDTRKIDTVSLLPNQKITFNQKIQKLQKVISVKPQMLSPLLATRIFSFTDAPLSDIIASLKEAYGVEITYDEQRIKNPTVTASLSRLPLEEKIRAVCKAIGANYEFQNNKISIY
jgi:transmembrane sensor